MSAAPAPKCPVSKRSAVANIILPDLVSHCDFKLHHNRHRKQVTVETKKWLFKGDNLCSTQRDAFHGLNAGLLTSMCYPNAGYSQLRTVNDFLTYLFYLDNLSDDMDNRGTKFIGDAVMNSLYHPYAHRSSTRVGRMAADFYKRILLTASPGTQQRFLETFDFFFQSVTQQAADRASGCIPDLESYIVLRRDTSGCKPCWALIECNVMRIRQIGKPLIAPIDANNLKIPDEVMGHPIILSLGEAANDVVTWSNDIFSYNIEQSKGDTHNMISVVMNEYGLDLQSAVDFVGNMCKRSIDRFNKDHLELPCWSPEIDRDVAIYVQGLADWIVGSLHWSFETKRYFRTSGREVKKSRIVQLWPRKASEDR